MAFTQLPLSFQSAKALRGQVEMLPKGPQWYCKPWLTIHPTKTLIMLFYHNDIECIEALFGNPSLPTKCNTHPSMSSKLLRSWSSTSPSSQVYSPEYIHQENSWATQQLPNSWVPQLYFETSENLCINWDHDVWSSGNFVIHIHTMCCLHGWHPGSYHALQSCRQNITSDFC